VYLLSGVDAKVDEKHALVLESLSNLGVERHCLAQWQVLLDENVTDGHGWVDALTKGCVCEVSTTPHQRHLSAAREKNVIKTTMVPFYERWVRIYKEAKAWMDGVSECVGVLVVVVVCVWWWCCVCVGRGGDVLLPRRRRQQASSRCKPLRTVT
jgi:hypothetical protein